MKLSKIASRQTAGMMQFAARGVLVTVLAFCICTPALARVSLEINGERTDSVELRAGETAQMTAASDMLGEITEVAFRPELLEVQDWEYGRRDGVTLTALQPGTDPGEYSLELVLTGMTADGMEGEDSIELRLVVPDDPHAEITGAEVVGNPVVYLGDPAQADVELELAISGTGFPADGGRVELLSHELAHVVQQGGRISDVSFADDGISATLHFRVSDDDRSFADAGEGMITLDVLGETVEIPYSAELVWPQAILSGLSLEADGPLFAIREGGRTIGAGEVPTMTGRLAGDYFPPGMELDSYELSCPQAELELGEFNFEQDSPSSGEVEFELSLVSSSSDLGVLRCEFVVSSGDSTASTVFTVPVEYLEVLPSFTALELTTPGELTVPGASSLSLEAVLEGENLGGIDESTLAFMVEIEGIDWSSQRISRFQNNETDIAFLLELAGVTFEPSEDEPTRSYEGQLTVEHGESGESISGDVEITVAFPMAASRFAVEPSRVEVSGAEEPLELNWTVIGTNLRASAFEDATFTLLLPNGEEVEGESNVDDVEPQQAAGSVSIPGEELHVAVKELDKASPLLARLVCNFQEGGLDELAAELTLSFTGLLPVLNGMVAEFSDPFDVVVDTELSGELQVEGANLTPEMFENATWSLEFEGLGKFNLTDLRVDGGDSPDDGVQATFTWQQQPGQNKFDPELLGSDETEGVLTLSLGGGLSAETEVSLPLIVPDVAELVQFTIPGSPVYTVADGTAELAFSLQATSETYPVYFEGEVLVALPDGNTAEEDIELMSDGSRLDIVLELPSAFEGTSAADGSAQQVLGELARGITINTSHIESSSAMELDVPTTEVVFELALDDLVLDTTQEVSDTNSVVILNAVLHGDNLNLALFTAELELDNGEVLAPQQLTFSSVETGVVEAELHFNLADAITEGLENEDFTLGEEIIGTVTFEGVPINGGSPADVSGEVAFMLPAPEDAGDLAITVLTLVVPDDQSPEFRLDKDSDGDTVEMMMQMNMQFFAGDAEVQNIRGLTLDDGDATDAFIALIAGEEVVCESVRRRSETELEILFEIPTELLTGEAGGEVELLVINDVPLLAESFRPELSTEQDEVEFGLVLQQNIQQQSRIETRILRTRIDKVNVVDPAETDPPTTGLGLELFISLTGEGLGDLTHEEFTAAVVWGDGTPADDVRTLGYDAANQVLRVEVRGWDPTDKSTRQGVAQGDHNGQVTITVKSSGVDPVSAGFSVSVPADYLDPDSDDNDFGDDGTQRKHHTITNEGEETAGRVLPVSDQALSILDFGMSRSNGDEPGVLKGILKVAWNDSIPNSVIDELQGIVVLCTLPGGGVLRGELDKAGIKSRATDITVDGDAGQPGIAKSPVQSLLASGWTGGPVVVEINVEEDWGTSGEGDGGTKDAATGLPTGKRQHKPITAADPDSGGDGDDETKDAATGLPTGKRQHKPITAADPEGGGDDGDGGTKDAASGLPTGKRQHKPVKITKPIDKATPMLMAVSSSGGTTTILADGSMRFEFDVEFEGENCDLATPVVSLSWDDKDNDCDDPHGDLRYGGGTVHVGLLLPTIQAVRENGMLPDVTTLKLHLVGLDGTITNTLTHDVQFRRLDEDTDGDGLQDGVEDSNKNGKVDPTGSGTGDLIGDTPSERSVGVEDSDDGNVIRVMDFGLSRGHGDEAGTLKGMLTVVWNDSIPNSVMDGLQGISVSVRYPRGGVLKGELSRAEIQSRATDIVVDGDAGQPGIAKSPMQSLLESGWTGGEVEFVIDVVEDWGSSEEGDGGTKDAASGLPTGKRQHKPITAADPDSGGEGDGETKDAANGLPTGKRQHKPITAADPDSGGEGDGETKDAASGLPTGKRQHKPISITKPVDAATPMLMTVSSSGGTTTILADGSVRFEFDVNYEGENCDLATPVCSLACDGRDNDCNGTEDDRRYGGGTVHVSLLLPAVQAVRENGTLPDVGTLKLHLVRSDGTTTDTLTQEVQFRHLDDDDDGDSVPTEAESPVDANSEDDPAISPRKRKLSVEQMTMNGSAAPVDDTPSISPRKRKLSVESLRWQWEDGGGETEDDWETPVSIADGGSETEDDWETPVSVADGDGDVDSGSKSDSGNLQGSYDNPPVGLIVGFNLEGEGITLEMLKGASLTFTSDDPNFASISGSVDSPYRTPNGVGADCVLANVKMPPPGMARVSGVLTLEGENLEQVLKTGIEPARLEFALPAGHKGDGSEGSNEREKIELSIEQVEQKRIAAGSDDGGDSGDSGGTKTQDYNSSRSNRTLTAMGGPDGSGDISMAIVFPDVVRTPAPAGPIPIPYPNLAQGGGIVIETVIKGAGTGNDVDSAWETCSGGGINIEIADASTGSDSSHQTTPGHKSAGEIVVVCILTADRQDLLQWYKGMVGKRDGELFVRLTDGTVVSIPLVLEFLDPDSDNDGVADYLDEDSDGDTVPDYLDDDDDGDGILDSDDPDSSSYRYYKKRKLSEEMLEQRSHENDGGGVQDGDEDSNNGTKAQDYNSSRSNRTVGSKDINEGDDASGDSGEGEGQGGTKAQDYNSSRSNRRGIVQDLDGDDDDSNQDSNETRTEVFTSQVEFSLADLGGGGSGATIFLPSVSFPIIDINGDGRLDAADAELIAMQTVAGLQIAHRGSDDMSGLFDITCEVRDWSVAGDRVNFIPELTLKPMPTLLPQLTEARKGTNEASAISSLRTMVSSQAMFYQGDVEDDDDYEYAIFVEIGEPSVNPLDDSGDAGNDGGRSSGQDN